MTPKLHHSIICALCVLGGFTLAAAEKPNVIVILTDDMGYADLPMFGDSEIPTPHLDRLAASGLKLTNAHTTAPICVPSRMGLLTGRYQHRFGIYDNVYSPGENRLWLQERTLADELKDRGYRTANVGKWHLSGNKRPWTLPAPHERGFDEFVGIEGGMDDFWAGTSLLRFENGEYQPFDAPEYLTDFFGKEAVAFIERCAGTTNQEPGTKNTAQPFFLYLAFNAPHAPLHALDEDIASIDADWISPERRIYGGMVVSIDRNVGRVLDALEKHRLRENTLIVFLNDNGGGGNNAATHTRNTARNAPFRGHKFDLEQGGVRTPMIVSWPGTLPAGETFAGLSSSLDIVPTALAAAGIDAPTDREIDGVNLLPFLTGQETGDPHEFLCWQQRQWARPNQRDPTTTMRTLHQFAIRSGQWKAIRNDQSVAPIADDPEARRRGWELYDITRDPGELQDLATEFPEITARLASQFEQWQAEMHPMITPPPAKP
jgi:arylsulfatase A-like enzyme